MADLCRDIMMITLNTNAETTPLKYGDWRNGLQNVNQNKKCLEAHFKYNNIDFLKVSKLKGEVTLCKC